MPHQDRYDPEMLDDDEDMSDLSFGERMEAEVEMRRRDRAEGRTKGIRRGLLYGIEIQNQKFILFQM
jgi:DNA replication licensing factor MCM2